MNLTNPGTWLRTVGMFAYRLMERNFAVSTFPVSPPSETRETQRLRLLTPLQWRGGIAAWLGWPFDGLTETIVYGSVASFFVQGVFGLFPMYVPPLFLMD